MSYPVLAFAPVESVRNIVEALTNQTFNGFPIVDSVHHLECPVSLHNFKINGILIIKKKNG